VSDWRHNYLAEYRLGFAMQRPLSHVMVTTDLGVGTAQEIMDELRESDPETHAKLSEIVVIGDDGKVLPESLDIIVAMINAVT
jgi:hypothetical protein